MQKSRHIRSREFGHAVIEVSLLAPWIFFLFVGALDFGFYGYAVISTQNAAQAAAMQTSQTTLTQADSTLACQYALTELDSLPNATSLSSCSSLPVIVNASPVVDADGAKASRVSVTYQTILMIPIPGLTNRLTLTRTALMRLRQQ